jgi:hypothetical protein
MVGSKCRGAMLFDCVQLMIPDYSLKKFGEDMTTFHNPG